MNKIYTIIHRLSLTGVFALPIIGLISSCGFVSLPFAIRDMILPLSFIAMTIYFASDSFVISLFQKIGMKIRNKKQREKILDTLIEERHGLIEKVRQIEEEITIIHAQDSQAERFVNKYIQTKGSDFVTKEQMLQFKEQTDQRLKRIEAFYLKNHQNNQIGTTEENNPRWNRTKN